MSDKEQFNAKICELEFRDLKCEEYREYDFHDRVYRIDNPVSLFFRPGGSTHRVVDKEGVAHCLPAPGINGCVLRWKSSNEFAVSF